MKIPEFISAERMGLSWTSIIHERSSNAKASSISYLIKKLFKKLLYEQLTLQINNLRTFTPKKMSFFTFPPFF
jgi:hypothetical protein